MITTAGDAALIASSDATGRLANGTFSLPDRCRLAFSTAAPAARSRTSVARHPTLLLTYANPSPTTR